MKRPLFQIAYLIAVICASMVSMSSFLFGQEVITVQPSATLRWDQIVQTDALHPVTSQIERDVSPPMPGPPPTAIESPKTEKSSNVESPIPYKRKIPVTTPSDISKISVPPIVNFQAL